MITADALALLVKAANIPAAPPPSPPAPVEPEPPPTPAADVPTDIDPREFLSMVMRGVVQASTNQMKAAVELAKIGHKPPGGVKGQRAEAAKTIASKGGRFAPSTPPNGLQ